MSYKKQKMNTIDEHRDETTSEPTVDVKKEKRLSQLAAARESAKTKKRQRDDDLSTMKETLNNLTTLLSAKKEKDPKEESDEEEEEKPKKRARRVTKEPEQVETDVAKEDTWSTSAIRSGALIALAGCSYYFSNIYGKTTPVAASKKKVAPPLHTNQYTHPVSKTAGVVGASGFSM